MLHNLCMNGAYVAHISSIRHVTVLCSGPLDTSAVYLGAILSEITNKKHRNAKHVPLSKSQERHVLTV